MMLVGSVWSASSLEAFRYKLPQKETSLYDDLLVLCKHWVAAALGCNPKCVPHQRLPRKNTKHLTVLVPEPQQCREVFEESRIDQVDQKLIDVDEEKKNNYEKHDVTTMTEQNSRLSYQGIGQFWSHTNSGHQTVSNEFANYLVKHVNDLRRHQLCHRISPDILEQRLKAKMPRFTVFISNQRRTSNK